MPVNLSAIKVIDPKTITALKFVHQTPVTPQYYAWEGNYPVVRVNDRTRQNFKESQAHPRTYHVVVYGNRKYESDEISYCGKLKSTYE
jgi:hypothetical protein